MSLLYDIKTSSGEVIEGCYFIEYMKTIRGGKSNVKLVNVPDSLQCFKRGEPIITNFTNAEILKIYDEESGKDMTEEIIEKYINVSSLLGYTPVFPIPRERVYLD